MASVFLAVAIVALIYRSRAVRRQAPFLASVRREWQGDAVILERILSDEDA
jgi:hypothetical protein